MDAEITTVFVNFTLFVPFPASQQQLRTPLDLLQLAKTAWNTEIVRNARGEGLHLTMRLPPLLHKGVLYAGPVATVRPSGITEMVGSGSVEAIVTCAHHARVLLLDAARRCPATRTTRGKAITVKRNPLLDQCTSSHEVVGLGQTSSEARYLETQRLLAALHGESTETSLFRDTTSLFTTPESVRGSPLLEATPPSVSFFNAILTPDVYILRRLQWHRVRKPAFTNPVSSAANREPRATLNVTGDAVLEWVHRFLKPVADSETGAALPTSTLRDDVFTSAELAYLTPKRETLKRVLRSFSARRFERLTGIQLILNFSTRKASAPPMPGHKRSRPTEGNEDADGPSVDPPLPDALDPAPNLTSVDFFFGDSILPSVAATPADVSPQRPRRTTSQEDTPRQQTEPHSLTPLASSVDEDDSSLPGWEETIKCSLFSTGKIQATARSESSLEIAVRLVLLPLLICCADIS